MCFRTAAVAAGARGVAAVAGCDVLRPASAGRGLLCLAVAGCAGRGRPSGQRLVEAGQGPRGAPPARASCAQTILWPAVAAQAAHARKPRHGLPSPAQATRRQ